MCMYVSHWNIICLQTCLYRIGTLSVYRQAYRHIPHIHSLTHIYADITPHLITHSQPACHWSGLLHMNRAFLNPLPPPAKTRAFYSIYEYIAMCMQQICPRDAFIHACIRAFLRTFFSRNSFVFSNQPAWAAPLEISWCLRMNGRKHSQHAACGTGKDRTPELSWIWILTFSPEVSIRVDRKWRHCKLDSREAAPPFWWLTNYEDEHPRSKSGGGEAVG
jgi:hypothetical protein